MSGFFLKAVLLYTVIMIFTEKIFKTQIAKSPKERHKCKHIKELR